MFQLQEQLIELSPAEGRSRIPFVNITCGICHLLYIKLRRILDQSTLVQSVEDRIKDGECLEEYQEGPHIVNADLAVIANKIEENQKIWDAEIKEVVRCLQDMDAKIKEIIRVL